MAWGTVPNRVKQLYQAGKCAYGTYIMMPSPASVEIAALSGFDFVRIDGYHTQMNPETLQAMVTTAHSYDITPWMRCRNDPIEIELMLGMGVQIVTIPNLHNAQLARAAVDAIRYPPKGNREASGVHRFAGGGRDYAEENILLSCQIESREGLENYKDIIRTEGMDCIQAGRGDIALALGLEGEFHPKVLEWEDRIFTTAMDAGKMVSFVHPFTDDGIERTLRWIERGMRVPTMDHDRRVMQRGFTMGLQRLRESAKA